VKRLMYIGDSEKVAIKLVANAAIHYSLNQRLYFVRVLAFVRSSAGLVRTAVERERLYFV